MSTPRIVTSYDPKPGFYRAHDWTAIDDDTYDGPGSAIGSGATEQEAIEDLQEQLAERDTGLHRVSNSVRAQPSPRPRPGSTPVTPGHPISSPESLAFNIWDRVLERLFGGAQ